MVSELNDGVQLWWLLVTILSTRTYKLVDYYIARDLNDACNHLVYLYL